MHACTDTDLHAYGQTTWHVYYGLAFTCDRYGYVYVEREREGERGGGERERERERRLFAPWHPPLNAPAASIEHWHPPHVDYTAETSRNSMACLLGA